jgi:hypothetical protein
MNQPDQGGPISKALRREPREQRGNFLHHITELLGRLRRNGLEEAGKLQATGKPQPGVITPPHSQAAETFPRSEERAPSSACGLQAGTESWSWGEGELETS